MSKTSNLEHTLSDNHTDHNRVPSLSDRVRSLRLADDSSSRAAAKGSTLPWLLCLILLATSTAFGYRAYRITPAEDQTGTNQAASNPATTQAPGAVAAAGEVVLQAKGYVIPVHQIQVSPKISGMIVWLNTRFEEGQRFKEGEVLARIEDTDYKADRDHAKAALESAVKKWEELVRGSRPEEIDQTAADLAETEKSVRQMKLDLDRNQRLAPGGGVAQRDYEQAKYGYEAMERRAARLRAVHKLMIEGPRIERIEGTRADVDQAQADLAKAQWRLDNCEIRAPISGTILTKKAEFGNIVNPAAFNISASLCDMANLSDVEIDLSIQERDIANVVVGQHCLVMPEAFQGFKPFLDKHPNGYEGVVSRLMPIADRAKGAVPVRVRLHIPKEEEGVYLKPDMGALVSFKKVEAK